MGKIAYLFPAFPVFHQTFVLWEVLGLRRNGMSPTIYSLRRGTAQQQPEGRDIADQVIYLPRTLSMPVWRANWRLLRRGGRRYLDLYLAVVRAWRMDGEVAQELRPERARVTPYNRLRGWFNRSPLLYLLKSLALVPTAVHLAEQLDAAGVTHLHAHWATYPATVAYVVHQISGTPFSISAHAYDIYMVQRMLAAKVQAATFLVTCAKTNAAFLSRIVGPELSQKIVVSYHGVDVSRFAPAGAEIRPKGQLRVVSCGQLERYKGMHLLIDACAGLVRQGLTIECAIVGEGPERANLQRQIEHLGLEKQVRLLGARPHAEVAGLLGTADVFVLASELAGRSRRRDVIANVIVEAMAAGLPVVASHIPGVEELIEHGVTGYLVPPNDVAGFAAAIKHLADHPDERRRFGLAARRRIVQDFDSHKNILALVELLGGNSAAAPPPRDHAEASGALTSLGVYA